MVTFTIFYIPVGLGVAGNWLRSKGVKEKKLSWFLVLLFVGIGICLPKLFRPIHMKKQGYREAANWLRENTSGTDIIAAAGNRIVFYAERVGMDYDEEIPRQAKYVVRIVKDKDEKPEWAGGSEEKFSVWVNEREKKKRIVIYEVL